MNYDDAIKALEADVTIATSQEWKAVLKLAIFALREATEREKGRGVVYHHRHLCGYEYITCPECKTEIQIAKPVEGDYPYCGGCGKVVLDAEQSFCGWCGNSLKEV